MVIIPIPPTCTNTMTTTCPKAVNVSLISHGDKPVVDKADAEINSASQKLYLPVGCPSQSYLK
jgi:hypothetical protein